MGGEKEFDPYSLQPAVTITLLVTAVLFPPIMLLNFPLLMFFTYRRFRRQQKLAEKERAEKGGETRTDTEAGPR